MEEVGSFGSWLRRRRKALDLTREELAQLAGCSVATIRKIEEDERRPSKQLAACLADHLALPPEERAMFLQCARGERAADRLVVPSATAALAPTIQLTKPSSQARPTTLLLQTKLAIPPLRAQRVARPHLIARLNQGLTRKLTLVSAPAGFGKTTLLSAWVADSDQRITWVSLDEGDNDPVRFWTYVIAALQQRHSDLGVQTLALLHAPQPPPTPVVLTALINAIAAIPERVVLVLDDYHVIHAQPIHDSLTLLLDQLPANLHLVLITRADPPLPLARLRARGQLTELRAADLRFTAEEAATFLRYVMGLQLAAADVAALEARTEGWIAGLQLAALSLQGLDDTADFIAAFTGSHRHIMDYLLEDVLARQPDQLQRFLLHTAVLDRLSGPLCDAVTGEGQSASMLAELERANLFLIALDHERCWYRYHHLFADVLRARLRQQPPHQIAELHRRAAGWYEEHGLVPEAIQHATAAGDWARLVRLVAAHAQPALAQGQVTTVQSWLDAVPHEMLCAQPHLCLVQAWVLLLRRQLHAIELFLQAAEQSMEAGDDTDSAVLRGELLTLRAFIASEQGRFDEAVALARRAQAYLPDTELATRSKSAVALGHALYSLGDTGPAIAALRESVALSQAAGEVLAALHSAGELVVLLVLQGQLRQAKHTLEQVAHWLTAHHWQHVPPACVVHIRLGDILREQNELQAAETHLNRAIQLAQFGAPITSARAHAFLARLKQIQGDRDGAHTALEHVEQISRAWETSQELSFFAAYRARIWLLQGDLVAAEHWADDIPVWDATETPSYFREFELVTLARVRVAQGAVQPGGPYLAEALALLAGLRLHAECGGRMGIVIETLILQALAQAAQADTRQALRLLERALALAEPEGYIRIFVDEGAPMAALLARVSPRHPQRSYADKLLTAFAPGTAPTAVSTPPSSPPHPLLEPLSPRELEVLRLMADGLSNQEIAARLVFTVATAKKHIEHIHSKLGVHRRTQAIARARALHLV